MSQMDISFLNFNTALSNTYPLKYKSWQETFLIILINSQFSCV